MFDVDFTGIGIETVTLFADAELSADDVGKVCKVSADKTAGPCAAEDVFYGVLSQVDLGGVNPVAAVDWRGFKEVDFSGDAPGLGYVELVADGDGGVKTPAEAGTGRMYQVVSVDAVSGTLFVDLG